ncbi:MAG TPA: 3-hydroxyacyl-CoA dehydrogenase NAD-binding domain-containing protein, partial [Casimicrobiaceae bacterium]|nr:3-hydroxyacyl-CoA dehydrogenase NAD-binding domain-containing protein [Casimicrobiaceae bacterium]
MTTAAMVGAGLIGRSWAMVFARAGWRVRVYDSVASQLDAAREHIDSGLVEQQQYGLADDAAAASARIEYVADLEQLLAGVDWVQENAPEMLDVKQELYA